MAAQVMLPSDEDLIERYQQSAIKDAHADQLFGRYAERVALWCWRFTGDRELARDLAQEVLLKAYLHLGSFRADAKFSTWLYSIARNHCLNHVRGQSREPLDRGEPMDAECVCPTNWDTLEELQRRAEAESVRRLVLEELDETEARVMLLHYAEEVPLPNVTRMLRLQNPSGAKAFVVSAKRKLAAAVRRLRARQERRTT
jgi:RNA polymerase sigma-70 factor (ECF subfamily)